MYFKAKLFITLPLLVVSVQEQIYILNISLKEFSNIDTLN